MSCLPPEPHVSIALHVADVSFVFPFGMCVDKFMRYSRPPSSLDPSFRAFISRDIVVYRRVESLLGRKTFFNAPAAAYTCFKLAFRRASDSGRRQKSHSCS